MIGHAIYPNLNLKQTISDNRLVGLWRLMGGFRMIYLGAILALSVATLAKTLTYLLLQYFVDDLLLQAQPELPFYVIGLGFVGLAVVQGGFTYLSGKLAARSAQGIILRLRNYLFDHIQRLPFTYHDHTQTGDLVQRCSSDVDTIQRFFADQAIGVGRILLLFIINFAALLSLNVKLAVLSLVTTPIVFIISIFFFRKIHQAYEAHQEQEGELSTRLQENLSGVRVVKAFARQPFEIDKFEESNQEQFKRGRTLLLMHASYWPIVETISGFQMLFIFFMGGLMAINGEITVGTYLAVAGLVIWIIWPMQNLGRLMVQTSMGLVSYTRIAEIITATEENLQDEAGLDQLGQAEATPPVSTNGAAAQPNGHYANGHNQSPNGYKNGPAVAIKGAVEFKNVSFEYNDKRAVLKDISFRVEPGQTVAIMGPTGSGKSSLVNLLPRFYDATAGTILLDGLPLDHYRIHVLRKQIGIVEQEPFLFSRTIGENIAYGVDREVSAEEIEVVARAAAIHEVIVSFPKAYETLVGERGVTLSGGQKQRLCIARTLLKNPPILIFDDAVSAVDTETETHIHAALEHLRQGRTTFVIAHRMQTVMRADKILVLDKGRIVQQGSHPELLAQPGIYQRTYQLQAQIERELE
jgi:ATP-binding cassette subfamily B protein